MNAQATRAFVDFNLSVVENAKAWMRERLTVARHPEKFDVLIVNGYELLIFPGVVPQRDAKSEKTVPDECVVLQEILRLHGITLIEHLYAGEDELELLAAIADPKKALAWLDQKLEWGMLIQGVQHDVIVGPKGCSYNEMLPGRIGRFRRLPEPLCTQAQMLSDHLDYSALKFEMDLSVSPPTEVRIYRYMTDARGRELRENGRFLELKYQSVSGSPDDGTWKALGECGPEENCFVGVDYEDEAFLASLTNLTNDGAVRLPGFKLERSVHDERYGMVLLHDSRLYFKIPRGAPTTCLFLVNREGGSIIAGTRVSRAPDGSLRFAPTERSGVIEPFTDQCAVQIKKQAAKLAA